MSAKTKNLWTILLIFTAAGFYSIGADVRAQEGDAPRRLWDGAFLKKRAEAKTSAPARKSTAYRRATPKKPAASNAVAQGPATKNPASQNQSAERAEGEVIGLTVWRLRPSKSTDDKESRLLLVDESSKVTEWTPERVEADTVFADGDRVRLSIESPRDGYLYVIDREVYTDGGASDPYLIFPTLNTRDGDNLVSAGKVIELPDGQASFKFGGALSNPKYAGEHLTILVTPEPLKNVQPGKSYVKLDQAMVAQWESQWSGSTERFEMIGGAGKAYTKAEKEAGQGGSRSLTQGDAMPQTLYQVDVKTGAPLLVKLPLRLGK